MQAHKGHESAHITPGEPNTGSTKQRKAASNAKSLGRIWSKDLKSLSSAVNRGRGPHEITLKLHCARAWMLGVAFARITAIEVPLLGMSTLQHMARAAITPCVYNKI